MEQSQKRIGGKPLPPPPSGPPPWFKDVPGTLEVKVRVLTRDHPEYEGSKHRIQTVDRFLANSPKASNGNPYTIEWMDPFHGKKHTIDLTQWATDARDALVNIECSFHPAK
ncbi:hypothetical protein EPA93_11465 [Ktedonosporobacter rubrisoli]|uniref:Uncharacterized protein n=1 Tax=Ktedonosporobacter rubrisoli TaxID=2509675 RepID=A0A4P6JMS2_KTERU|nr:hypothetical protein [Ktedonosporobacter rubrisoli]QBD76587.1 hypothetical protein EPA93_11465 [Ktedonosporobacter rubrisoli]